ncbi:MAG: hypothetical protein WA957_05415 [Alteraurantiacibacter sp.]
MMKLESKIGEILESCGKRSDRRSRIAARLIVGFRDLDVWTFDKCSVGVATVDAFDRAAVTISIEGDFDRCNARSV